LPVIPFLPFWRLIQEPVAVRIQGAVFFLVALGLIGRITGARLGAVLLGSLLYPIFLFLFLDDTGPNGLTILLDLLALLSVRGAVRAKSPGARLGRAGLAGGFCFLGIFAKPVFALYLPALVVFGAFERRAAARRDLLLRELAVFGAAVVLPTALLLFSLDRRGQPYLAVLQKGGLSFAAHSVSDVAHLMTGYLAWGSRIVPRTLTLPESPIDWLPGLASVWLLGTAIRSQERRTPAACFLAMASVTFLLTLGVGAASEPHHLAFTLTPVVLALTAALGSGDLLVRTLPAVACVIFWGSLAARWPKAEVSLDTGKDKDRLVAFLRTSGLERRTVQVHASWGTYYIAHLFGDPEQAVVSLDAFGAPAGALQGV
ncbi:MAG TPA: hypothetical protein VN083_08310, partial [Vicinamibacteria bacterium]|nr:hypothetical protein [Vicinamibacteria bacterium]